MSNELTPAEKSEKTARFFKYADALGWLPWNSGGGVEVLCSNFNTPADRISYAIVTDNDGEFPEDDGPMFLTIYDDDEEVKETHEVNDLSEATEFVEEYKEKLVKAQKEKTRLVKACDGDTKKCIGPACMSWNSHSPCKF